MSESRQVWETIGEKDPHKGTGGPTKALPGSGRFASPDTGIFRIIEPKASVLDVGCGYGRNTTPLSKVLGCPVTACDISLHMSSNVIEGRIPFVLCDLRKLPFRNLSFDNLLCSVVLIHLKRKEIEGALAELRRVGKKLLIVMPNPLGPASFFGFIPLTMSLFVWVRKRRKGGQPMFHDVPCPRGYIVNFYLPWMFRTLLKRQFDEVVVKAAVDGKVPHPYLTDRILYVCNSRLPTAD